MLLSIYLQAVPAFKTVDASQTRMTCAFDPDGMEHWANIKAPGVQEV